MEESGQSSPNKLDAIPKISILGATPIQSPENSSDDETRNVKQPNEVEDGEVKDAVQGSPAENGADDNSEEQTVDIENDGGLEVENGGETNGGVSSEQEDADIETGEVSESQDTHESEAEEPRDESMDDDVEKSAEGSDAAAGEGDDRGGDGKAHATSVSFDSGIASFAATSGSTGGGDVTSVTVSADDAEAAGPPDAKREEGMEEKEEDCASVETPDVDRGPMQDADEDIIDFTIDTEEYGEGASGLPPQLGNFMFLSGMPQWGGGMMPMGSLLANLIGAKLDEEEEEGDAMAGETGKRKMKRESSEDDTSSLEEQQDRWQDLMRLLEEQHQQQLLMQQQQHDQQLKMVEAQVEFLARKKQQRKARRLAKMQDETLEKETEDAGDAEEEKVRSKKEENSFEVKEVEEETKETEEMEDVDTDGATGDAAEKPQEEVVKTVDEKGDGKEIQPEEETKAPAEVSPAVKKAADGEPQNTSGDNFLDDYSYWKEDQDDFVELRNTAKDDETTETPTKEGGQQGSPPGLLRSFSSPTMSDAFLNSSQRLTLREKHARHMADLRAYYEAEINELKDQLSSSTSNIKTKSPYKRLERNNAKLKERCERLEIALKSANNRIEELENTVLHLQIQVTDGAQRYEISSGTVKALEQRIENLKLYCKQKEAQLQRADRRNRDLDSSLQDAYRLQDEQYTRSDSKSQEMLEKLMIEYETLGKEHDNTKVQLSKTETDLYDTKSEAATLKRSVSKLELEIKRLDRENTIMREGGYSPTISLSRLREKLSESKSSAESTSTYKKWLQSSVDYNMFTGEDKTDTKTDLSTSYLSSSRLSSTGGLSSRDVSGYHDSFLGVSSSNDLARPISPMIRAAVQLDQWKEAEKKRQTSPRQQTSLSPSKVDVASTYARLPDTTSPRSSSFTRSPRSSRSVPSPGRARTNATNDVSPRFQGLLQSGDSNTTRFDVSAHSMERPVRDDSPRKVDRSPARDWLLDSPNTTARSTLSASSPRTTPTSSKRKSPHSRTSASPASTRLDFSTSPRTDVSTPVDSVLDKVKSGVYTASPRYEKTSKRSKQSPDQSKSASNSESEIMARIRKIRETEKRLDELIEEKKQLESSLSRIPNSGPRATPQAKRDQEKIEQRLDEISSELGTIRMILRRHHVIKTS